MNKLEEFFYTHTEEWFHIRKLAKILDVSPNTVRKWAAELLDKGIAEKRVNNNMVEFRGNLDDKQFMTNKKLNNLQRLYDSGLVELLADYYKNAPIVLFGSYSRGENHSNSDIDIAIISSNKKRPDLSEYEKILKHSINLSLFSKTDVSEEFMNNIINGVVLSGVIRL